MTEAERSERYEVIHICEKFLIPKATWRGVLRGGHGPQNQKQH